MSDQRLTIDIETKADVSGATSVQSELRKVEQEANKADQALSNMGKGSTAKLPLSASMQELLSSAQSARTALNTMAENSGLDGLRSNLKQSSQLIDEIRSKANLGLALGQGGNYDTSAFRDLSSYASHMSGAIKGASGSMREFGNETARSASTVKSSNGIFSNFSGSLMRIAKLRLLRGIVRSVTGAFKEGVGNIYQYSAALNNADASHMKSTMDGLASALLQMKNTIGSAVAPLLSAIVPILKTIVGWITAAIDALAQFFAVLNGQKTYTRAKEVSVAWQNTASNLGTANDNAKKLQRTLLGFDEINALDAPQNGSGAGGGGGGDSVGPSQMFEEAPVATTGFQGVLNKIAEALRPIVDLIKGMPGLIEGAFELLVAALEGDYEATKKALNKLQKLFSTNKSMGAVFEFFVDKITTLAQFIYGVMGNIKIRVLTAAKNILIALRPILEAMGVDVSAAIKQIDSEIEKTKKGISKGKESIKEWGQTLKEWSQGKISTENMLTSLQILNGAFGSTEKQVKLAKEAVKSLEENGFKPDILTTGMDKVKTAGEKAQLGIRNVKQAIEHLTNDGGKFDVSKYQLGFGLIKKQASESKLSVDELNKKNKELIDMKFNLSPQERALNDFGKASEDASKKLDGAKGSMSALGKAQLNMSGQKGQIDNVKNSASGANSTVGHMRGSLAALNEYHLNTNKNVGQIGNIKNESYYATGNVNNVKSSLGDLDRVQMKGTGIQKFFSDLGTWVLNTDSWVGNLIRSLTGLNNLKTTVTTTTPKKKKDGGFVTRKDGGFIPRFDGGGINTADIFLANENGMPPEMIGHIGNRTAVANQGQMVEAMAQGVYEAMMEVMSANGNTNEVNVYIDGDRVARAVDRANRLTNRRFNVGVV